MKKTRIWNTTRKKMRKLSKGDVFYINGEEHKCSSSAKPSNIEYRVKDKWKKEYVVFDENNRKWSETAFPVAI